MFWGPSAGEDDFFQPSDDVHRGDVERRSAGYQSQSGEPGQAAHSGHSGFAAANADQQAGSFAREPEARQDGPPEFGGNRQCARSADDAHWARRESASCRRTRGAGGA